MDSPVRVLVGFRVNVGFGAWKFNCRKVRGLLLWLNMHTAHQQALDRQTITKTSDSEGSAEQSAVGVKRVFTQEKSPHIGSKDLSNPCAVLLRGCRLPFASHTYRARWFYDTRYRCRVVFAACRHFKWTQRKAVIIIWILPAAENLKLNHFSTLNVSVRTGPNCNVQVWSLSL